MRFGVLGPLAAWTDDGEPVAIPGAKVRALLADLLVHPGQLLSADRLVDDLWADDLPGNPTGTLQGKVSQLRRALEDATPGGRELVRYQAPGYTLDIDPMATDAGRFEELLARARRLVTDEPGESLTLLAEALDLWRGPALAEFVDEPFARPVITHLEEARLTALEARAEARLALGEHSAVIGELDALVAEHPLRERLRALHMRALYGAGRQAEALDSYQQLRDHLADELGLDPSPELDELQQAILMQDAALSAPTPSAVRPRHNVPAPRTPFVGATDSIDDVAGLLAAERLVTLVGPGGVGKTRLALETARAVVDEHPGGVWLVELAGSHDAAPGEAGASLGEQVAGLLGVRVDGFDSETVEGQEGELIERIAGAVGDERLLLVLDNCEHVLEPAAGFADRLLRATGGLRILATSRLPLGLTGEQLCPVAPLAVSDAADLFTARAAAAVPGFTVGDGNRATVEAICRRLDGLPLALELAAARLRTLSVNDLAERLDDRFALLTRGPRDAPERQQTLGSLIDWSWALLTPEEQAALARLSVFAGPATLPAVEAVWDSEALDVIAQLVDHSLVVAETAGGGARYRLLETIRAYGLKRLEEAGDVDDAHRRHAAYYTALAEEAEPSLRGHGQERWLERLDADAANLRAAAEWATANDAGLALRLLNALAWHAYLRGHQGRVCRQLTRALEAGGDPPAPARARAHAWLGSLGALDRSVADPPGHARAALGLYAELDEPAQAAHAKLLLAGLLLPRGELPDAARLADEALDAFRELGDDWGAAGALSTRGWLELGGGDLSAAWRDGEESKALYVAVGDRWGQVRSAELLAHLAEINGDYDDAEQLHRDALKQAEALGLWAAAALELGRLGRLAILTGDEPAAVELHERALRLSRQLAFEQGTAFARVGLGLIARRQGRLDEAEEHIGAVLGWHEERGFVSGVAYCLAELGFTAELRGDAQRARELHLRGFEAARRTGDSRAVALAIEGLAGAAVAAGEWEHAALLLGVAGATRSASGAALPPAERGDVDRVRSVATAALGDETFEAAFERGTTLDPDDALHFVVRR